MLSLESHPFDILIAKQHKIGNQPSLTMHQKYGSDVITGGAKNPQQFDDPDDDALDEMAKLLDEDDD